MGNSFEELKGLRGHLKKAAPKENSRLTKATSERSEAASFQNSLSEAREPQVPVHVTREDHLDFARVMREAGVVPFGQEGAFSNERRKKESESFRALENAYTPLSDEAKGLGDFVSADDGLGFRRHKVGPDVLRDLKRGRWVVTAQIDLHGMFVEEARQAVKDFICAAYENERHCVRIIHGKGNGSPQGESVLRECVRTWLRQCNEVLAYVEPYERDGGAGATLVRLAKK